MMYQMYIITGKNKNVEITSKIIEVASKSSAPASIASNIKSSSDIVVESFSITIIPFFSNMYDTQPDVPKFPPALSNTCLTSAAVLFLLSVDAFTLK